MMEQSTSKRAGIRDWLAKRALLKVLYGVSTNKALFEEVVDKCYRHQPPASAPRGRSGGHTTFLEAVVDAQGKWDESRPSDAYLDLWQFIRNDFNLDCAVARLLECSFEDFVDLLGNNVLRDHAETLVDDRGAPLTHDHRQKLNALFSGAPASVSDHRYPIWRDRRTYYEGPLSARRDGQCPIWRFYNAPEAARAWTALIDSKNYRMYLDCLCSLKQCVEEEYWTRALRERRYNAAVSLAGGGSPEKDLVVARSLLRSLDDYRGEVQYVIVDISADMIHETERLLGPRLQTEGLDRIRVTDENLDILQFEGQFPRREHWQCVVWAILGGTIGNLPERDFFRSLKDPSRSGDLLIVGLDTHDNESWEEFESRMQGQYRCKELDDLLQAQPLWAGGVERRPVVEVSVRKREEGDPEHHVRGSWIAEFKYRSDDRSKVLSSTRYVLKEFLAFACELGGWEHLGTTAAPDGSTFRQLLLRRM